jgi:hypothetical protein
MEPTETDLYQMREAFGFDEIFLGLTEERKRELFKGVLEIRRVMEFYDDVAELTETTERTKYALKLQTHLQGLLEVFEQKEGSAHLLDLMVNWRDALEVTSPEIVKKVDDYKEMTSQILRSSKRARPRKKAPPNRPPKALAEVRMMKTLLEGVGVTVGATGGGTGGPATRLMARIHKYVTGGEVISHDSIRNRLTRLKKWEAGHQRIEDKHSERPPS